ncbi:nucleolar protein 8 [Antechinus flavipes]|uniref:nucleolar protein 8 n=1 Tax=Antechinus flavipes TaxID=38775 RepID=UPI0022364126|nr:nucleolar protein 8 [Antechinus flavipes]
MQRRQGYSPETERPTGRERSPGTLDRGIRVPLAGKKENGQLRIHVTGSRKHVYRKPGPGEEVQLVKSTMAASPGERRLFVGGLGPSVTQDDVRAQLGRFGVVSSVELVSRVNELGLPEKTFAYANVRLSEGDLKKCMSALNKTTWKGGTLQVQLAKESFLHRLAEERLQAKAQQEACPQGGSTASPPTILEFHMKKAVPGTEVPGHKDWVVSKFGRVLPVLHLRSQNRRKILKYDPSKYCHNLKKFEQDVTKTVSVSDLTWKLEGGDDVMSKKRQGQFPAFRSHPVKRAKVEGSPFPSSRAAGRPEPPSAAHPNTARPQPAASQKAPKPEAGPLRSSKSLSVRSRNATSDDDVDSEEELKAMIAEEKSRRPALPETNGTERDSFEVVSSDFKPNPPRAGGTPRRPQAPRSDSPAQLAEDDQEYDSGDTDEIIACGKNGDQSKDEPKMSPKEKPKAKAKAAVRNGTNCARATRGINKRESADCTKHVTKKPGGAPPGSEDGESEEDLDYEAMMTNCYRLDLTLTDLEKLATEAAEGPGGSVRRTKRALPEGEGAGSGQKTKKAPKGARCINPKDILASLLEGEEKTRDQNPPKESMPKAKFQAFKGVGALYGGETPKRPFRNGGIAAHVKAPNSLKQAASPIGSLGKQAFDLNTLSGDEMSASQDGREAEEANSPPHHPKKPPRRRAATGEQLDAGPSPSPGSASGLSPLGSKKPSRLSAETCRMDSRGRGGLGASAVGDPCRESSDPVTLGPPPGTASSRVPEKDPPGTVQKEPEGPRDAPADAVGPQKPSQDNEKRLAALEERKRARELQKRLVHSALSGLDGRPVSKPTHILFNSDSEEETDVKGDAHEKPLPDSGGKRDSKASGRLFESSEDEEETEEDRARFQIKPQFEGKAGKKLMSLQSHFGADDRFRMDARFLESESEEEEEELKEAPTAEEEELVAEKRKNLELLRNILHVGQAPKPSREEVASKRFRNVVRYDPTRLDHATFERKAEPEEKESKAKRRKKRAEAEALPAVSKDQYYSIAADLKERFRAPEPEPTAGAGSPGSETPEAGEMAGPPTGSGEFTFSFFGLDVGEHEEAPYRVETKTGGRKAWQQDPRFQDSSSEEEEEEEPRPPDGSTAAAQPEETPASKALSSRFFFFSEDDERLRAGPGSFWQGSGSQPSGEAWESRTLALLQDCRKKHKSARRKAKP